MRRKIVAVGLEVPCDEVEHLELDSDHSLVLVWHMLTKREDYRYASPALTREKANRLHRLATGQRPPRQSGQRSAQPRHRAGREAEAAYEGFLEERFGPQGPPVMDHPNQEPIKKKPRKRSTTG